MRRFYTLIILLATVSITAPLPARAQTTASADLTKIQARLHDMGGRTISTQEWTDIISELHRLAADAEARGEGGAVVDARLVEARAWADLRRQPAQGIPIVEALRKNPPARVTPEAMRHVYATEAEWRARTGESDAIRRLIIEFKGSPYFDPRSFQYSGGHGPQSPLVVRRPFAGSEESRTLLAMETSLRKSLLAPGAMFPEFTARDEAGRTWSPDALRGKAYLVDFWTDSVPWRRDLPTLIGLRSRYPSARFEVIGVSLMGADAVRRLQADAAGAGWPQVVGPDARTWAAQCGLFGEAASFLVDQDGRIRGRNLKGADLAEAVRALLGE
ncbi:MAG: TlpA family protein disulfide reductase [Kiritimatiellae bacterium]|nr:TlpA family protein disulfide reductase [Kiritimatiellia bacterium]